MCRRRTLRSVAVASWPYFLCVYRCLQSPLSTLHGVKFLLFQGWKLLYFRLFFAFCVSAWRRYSTVHLSSRRQARVLLVYSYHEVTCRLEYTEVNGDLLPLIGRGCDGNSIHGIMSCICKSVFQALIKFKLASEWNFRDSWAASWCISILQRNIYFLIAQNSTHLQKLQIYTAGDHNML